VVLGSFLSNTDMQSGSPSFGTPESATGLLCTGQIARHLGLPWRSGGGGLTSSQTVDGQAAYETVMTMLPAMLAGANYVMHAAGWLESGLVSSYEKFIVDLEVLRRLEATFGEADYQPLLDAAEHASDLWRLALDEYEAPPLDPDLRDELRAFVDRRRKELGD
jgi:trimethylamine--corrinoid protein Co-methyltransferase